MRHAWLVFAVAIVVFLPTFGVPFLDWDDTYYVTQSLRTHRPGLDGFLQLWSMSDVLEGRFFEFFPLRDSVLWIVWHTFGQVAWAFHAVSMLGHAVCSVLVLKLGRRLHLSAAAALGGALLFALHPSHVESVSWIASIKDPLFAAFTLGSVLLFLRWRDEAKTWLYLVSLVCLVAALLCKSIAICTPVLMLVLDRRTCRTSWRNAVLAVVAPAVIAAIGALQTVMIGKLSNAVVPPHGGSWGAHYFLSAWALVRFVQQAVVPWGFSLQHCFRPPHGFDLRYLGLAALAVGVLGCAWLARQRYPKLLWVLGWFFGALLPVSNVFPTYAVMADRYLYLPSVASCLALGWLVRGWGIRRGWLLLVGVAAIYGAITVQRQLIWWHESALWAEAVADPACAEDDQTITALAFLKDATFQTTPRAQYDAFKKGVEHPAFSSLLVNDRCTWLIQASIAAQSAQVRGDAIGLARRATTECPERALGWARLVSAAAGIDRPLAAIAAQHAYRLAPTPANLWQLGQARLAAGDEGGLAQIDEAVASSPPTLCEPFSRWAAATRHTEDSRLVRAVTACSGH